VLNRRVRNRTHGGVGGRGSNPPPTRCPQSRASFASRQISDKADNPYCLTVDEEACLQWSILIKEKQALFSCSFPVVEIGCAYCVSQSESE
ncbi:hypothetical protein, partial [Gimesia sp.]|uniref:hypothetical protein n=1 Tax=Gimesia sp. TaxID=2024833 RepID=UPI003A8E10A5